MNCETPLNQVSSIPIQDMDAQQPLVIDMTQLSALVGGNLRSMQNAFYLNPADFPPAIDIPGCRGVRFLMPDVLVWLESRKAKAPTVSTAPRPRGRPRLAQQMGKGVRS